MTNEHPKIRILLVEDNHLIRLGTSTLVGTQDDMEVVGEVDDGVAAIEAYADKKPDVVIADLRMPVLDGVQLTEALKQRDPKVKVLVLSYYDGDENIFRALRAGALGYVTKSVRPSEILHAIRAVYAGERYLPAALVGQLADRVTQPALSPRELQTLEFVFKGLSNREIAETMAVAERTVSMYVSNVLAKLGVKSRTEAISVALGRGILQQE